MSDRLQLLERRLAKAYADQATHYDAALAILERQHRSAHDDADNETWTLELQRALDDVSAIDRTLAEDKQAWQQSGLSPGEPLRSILEGIGQRIRTLTEFVDGKVAALTAKRRQFMPELDGFIRQRRMLKAYDQYASFVKDDENARVS